MAAIGAGEYPAPFVPNSENGLRNQPEACIAKFLANSHFLGNIDGKKPIRTID